MQTIVITAPQDVSPRLADSLHRYFRVEQKPTSDPRACKIEVVEYERGRRIAQLLCSFVATEKPHDVVELFWVKYRLLFPKVDSALPGTDDPYSS